MEKLLLVGAGGFGRVVLEHARETYDCAFLDDGVATIVDDVSVIGKTSEMATFYPEYKLLLVTIGNNKLREQLYIEAKAIGYTFPNIIAPSAYVSPRSHIGSGCVILNNVVVQNNATCGDGCILNPGVELHHDSTIGSYCLIYTNSVPLIHYRMRKSSIGKTHRLKNLTDCWTSRYERYEALKERYSDCRVALVSSCMFAIGRFWIWYYGCSKEESAGSIIREMQTFAREHKDDIKKNHGYSRTVKLSCCICRFSNPATFWILYHVNLIRCQLLKLHARKMFI